jgi:hypothetical protein
VSGQLSAGIVLLALTGMAAANDLSDKFRAMTEQARHAELTDLIKPTGQPCDAVVRSMHIEDDNVRSLSVWSVECKDKNSYSVTIFPPGFYAGLRRFALVSSCQDLKSLSVGLFECWKKR